MSKCASIRCQIYSTWLIWAYFHPKKWAWSLKSSHARVYQNPPSINPGSTTVNHLVRSMSITTTAFLIGHTYGLYSSHLCAWCRCHAHGVGALLFNTLWILVVIHYLTNLCFRYHLESVFSNEHFPLNLSVHAYVYVPLQMHWSRLKSCCIWSFGGALLWLLQQLWADHNSADFNASQTRSTNC